MFGPQSLPHGGCHRHDRPMPIASIRGAEIYYELTGEGPPLVLTMGQGTGPDARTGLITMLAASHCVLTYDQRGTGRSERVDAGQSMEAHAQDIVGLMDHLGLAKAHLMGISTGTGIATVFAASHPERLDHLVLAAPWTHGDADLHVLQNMRKEAARSMAADHYTQFNALLIYSPEYRQQNAVRFEALARNALKSPQDATAIALRLNAILAFDARSLYPRIQAPTLVLGARDDLVMPYWHAEDAARAIRRAELVMLEHGGHLFAETRTAEFSEKVLSFLAATQES